MQCILLLTGAVGIPFPDVEVRLVDHDGTVLVESTANGSEVKAHSAFIEGELQVRGHGIFREYWNRPEATAESFTKDGWFITGDVLIASIDLHQGFSNVALHHQ